MDEKSCWTCGHFLIGGACFKNGEKDAQFVEHDYLCDEWVPENTEGTITYEITKHVEENLEKND